MDENIINAVVGRVIKYLEKNNPLSQDEEEYEDEEYYDPDEDEDEDEDWEDDY